MNNLTFLQVTSTMLAQRHSSVFHAGVIGHGPRRPSPENLINKEVIAVNRMLLIDVIKVKNPTKSSPCMCFTNPYDASRRPIICTFSGVLQ